MAFSAPKPSSGDVDGIVNIDVNLDNFTLQDLLKLRADTDRRRLAWGPLHMIFSSFKPWATTSPANRSWTGPPQQSEAAGPVQGLLSI